MAIGLSRGRCRRRELWRGLGGGAEEWVRRSGRYRPGRGVWPYAVVCVAVPSVNAGVAGSGGGVICGVAFAPQRAACLQFPPSLQRAPRSSISPVGSPRSLRLRVSWV